MTAEQMKSVVKVCMFDQYGTVVDMQTGLVEAATPFLRAKGWQGNPNSFVTWWRRTHFENSMIDALLHREHTPYREIGERSVAHVMDRAGIATRWTKCARWLTTSCGCGLFPKCRRRWTDCVPAIGWWCCRTAIRICWRPRSSTMASRSNATISVAAANSFKPHVATYTKAAEIIGVRMDEVLFIANHAFDCIGAKAAGMRTAFIDRRQRPFGATPHQPDLLVPSMSALANTIA